MKNKKFFYQQYEKVNWPNQDKTKINSFLYDFIIKNHIAKVKSDEVKVFDMGFGIGLLLRTMAKVLPRTFKRVVLEGCEPSYKNYEYFKSKRFNFRKVNLRTFNETFLGTSTGEKFDFIISSYTFTNFVFEDLDESVRKASSMLEKNGKMIVVVSNEKYLKKKLLEKRDLFIEENIINFNGRKYKELLHYTEIPQIGTIIDYNREEKFYPDLFKKHGFRLDSKKDLDDNGFIATVFVFSK